jgi:hypothetical protein
MAVLPALSLTVILDADAEVFLNGLQKPSSQEAAPAQADAA